MKYYILILFIVSYSTSPAQTEIESEIKNSIDTFFKGFHKQDSTIIKSVVYKEVILQSIGKNREGATQLITQDFSTFLKSIVAIPKDKKFEEKLLSYIIKIDGNMAHVWTDYEFWYDGQFSHCGVNSFQLIKDHEQWKIFYLIDTRRKEGCEN